MQTAQTHMSLITQQAGKYLFKLYNILSSKNSSHCMGYSFTCKSSYCFQCNLAIAILSVYLSVRPTVTWVDQSKMVKLGL